MSECYKYKCERHYHVNVLVTRLQLIKYQTRVAESVEENNHRQWITPSVMMKLRV